jgi:hypothetical protein
LSPPATISVTIKATSIGNGDREHQRSERLADAVRDDLRVMDRREHGRSQHETREHQHRRRRLGTPGRRREHGGDDRYGGVQCGKAETS